MINLYTIKYLPTKHVFQLPAHSAEYLLKNFPKEYKILQKHRKVETNV